MATNISKDESQEDMQGGSGNPMDLQQKSLQDVINPDVSSSDSSMLEMTRKLKIEDSKKQEVFQPVHEMADDHPVLIRKCYVDLFNEYVMKHDDILVSGNPGIGKSTFMQYVYWRLLKETGVDKVIFILGYASASCYYYIQDGKEQMLSSHGDVLEKLKEKDNKDRDAYYLFDCGTKEPFRPSRIAALKCKKSVVFSSPAKVNYHDYHKFISDCRTRRGVEVFMPTWNQCEIDDYLSSGFTDVNAVEVQRRFDIFGGIVRHIFESDITCTKALSDLHCAIQDCHTSKILKLANDYKSGTSSDNHSHKLLQIVPCNDYTSHTLDFNSDYIAKKVLERGIASGVENFMTVLKETAGIKDLATLRGRYFEPYAHYMLMKGKTFKRRCLEDNNMTTSEVTIKPTEKIIFERSHEGFLSNVYYEPKSKTYESVDSILTPSTVFQMTVSLSHSIKVSGIQEVYELLHAANKEVGCIDYYFVVPGDIFEEYKKQSYLNKSNRVTTAAKTIKFYRQWVLSVPIV